MRAGHHILGVRVTDPTVGELVERLLDPVLAPDEDPPPNLSLVVAGPAGPVQELDRLWFGRSLVIRSRGIGSPLDVLLGHLDAYARLPASVHAAVHGVAVVRDGRAHVLPQTWQRTVVNEQRGWHREGFSLVGRPWADVDLETGDVVVPKLGLPVDAAALAALRDLHAGDGSLVAPGRYPIASWTAPQRPRSPAHRVATTGQQIGNLRDLPARQSLERLVERLEEVPHVEHDRSAGSLQEQLIGL